MSDHLTRRQRWLGTAVLAPVAFAGLAFIAPAAAADNYPPTLPGPTETAPEVAGTRTTAPAEEVEVRGARAGRLAVTGADAVPYLAGAGVLLVGGSVLVIAARRKDRADHSH